MEGKTKIQLEYIVNCSPKVLYNRLSTASGLAEWFADDVNVKGKTFTFVWEGSEQTAEMTLHKENKMVRYTWEDEEDGEYFEFKITQDAADHLQRKIQQHSWLPFQQLVQETSCYHRHGSPERRHALPTTRIHIQSTLVKFHLAKQRLLGWKYCCSIS